MIVVVTASTGEIVEIEEIVRAIVSGARARTATTAILQRWRPEHGNVTTRLRRPPPFLPPAQKLSVLRRQRAEDRLQGRQTATAVRLRARQNRSKPHYRGIGEKAARACPGNQAPAISRTAALRDPLSEAAMEVILLERVARLGQMGDVVRVKDGFARNFLLPRGKALRATAENRGRYETMKGDLEARSLTLKTEASQVAGKLDGKSFTVLRQASESGQLFGSISPRDLVTLIGDAGFRINRSQIALNAPIKTIGQHKVPISLHPEVESTVTVIVARNEEEAARIARGEDLTQLRETTEAEAARVAAEEFFEPGAGEASRQDEDAEA